MSVYYISASICAMALTTYLIRVIPFAAFRKKIRSPFIQSFLHYVPYAVLGAMTLPAILYSTGSLITGAVGFGVALILSYRRTPLLLVAVSACLAAFVTGLIVGLV